MTNTIDNSLAGRRIAVPETRELEIFSALLERRGAEVVRCPLVAIRDTPDSAAVLSFAERLAEGQFQDFILLTGEGLKRILGIVDKYKPALRERFVAGLAKVRTITRGPKPARVLRELSLKPNLEAAEHTTDGLIATLSTEDLANRRVAVQLYGEDLNPALMNFLRSRGADVTTVAPYIYGDAASEADVRNLLERMAAGEIDAIAFTSKLQVERLCAMEPRDLVRRALTRTALAAVGPLVAEALTARGLAVASSPEHSWFMKPLVAAMSEKLGKK